jgi:hypothetical protein
MDGNASGMNFAAESIANASLRKAIVGMDLGHRKVGQSCRAAQTCAGDLL